MTSFCFAGDSACSQEVPCVEITPIARLMREKISETPIHGLHLRFTDCRRVAARKQFSFQLNAVSVVCLGIC